MLAHGPSLLHVKEQKNPAFAIGSDGVPTVVFLRVWFCPSNVPANPWHVMTFVPGPEVICPIGRTEVDVSLKSKSVQSTTSSTLLLSSVLCAQFTKSSMFVMLTSSLTAHVAHTKSTANMLLANLLIRLLIFELTFWESKENGRTKERQQISIKSNNKDKS